MSDLIVIAFPDEAAAFRARAEFVALQKDYLVEMEDVVVITRSETGEVKLHQAINMTAAGATSGTIWGTLVGLLFLNPLLGAAVGAGAGALTGALTDLGIDDDFLREVGGSLDQGGAALAVLLHKMTADRVIDRIATLGGRVLQTSLPADVETRLRERLEAATAHPPVMPPVPAPEVAGAPPVGLAGAPAAAPAPVGATPHGQSGVITEP